MNSDCLLQLGHCLRVYICTAFRNEMCFKSVAHKIRFHQKSSGCILKSQKYCGINDTGSCAALQIRYYAYKSNVGTHQGRNLNFCFLTMLVSDDRNNFKDCDDTTAQARRRGIQRRTINQTLTMSDCCWLLHLIKFFRRNFLQYFLELWMMNWILNISMFHLETKTIKLPDTKQSEES